MKENRLKPCPFCGSKAFRVRDVAFTAETGESIGKVKAFVMCRECPALVSGFTKEEADNAWNRRVE